MMSTFNTSTRREDISVRLKAQNLRNAKEQTKQLEEESRKMEERLRELKMAMSREKEERERQGGFWKSGQTGNLHSYAQDVLDAKQTRQLKSKVMKVLKDETLHLPHRSKAPGTIGYIASKKVSPKDKRKGPQCGQCEERGASVTCAQCGEDYCAGCFAAFHLKGALKKHRSVPIQANTPRPCLTPRLTPPASSRDLVTSHLPAEGDTIAIGNGDGNRNSPEGASGSFSGPSLLAGNYDENGSAASFQEALRAWRSGDSNQTIATTPATPALIKPARPSKSSSGSQSKVKPAVISVEHSTSTVDTRGDNSLEVVFHDHNISYAERLLLKKHRKTEVGQLPYRSPSGMSEGFGECHSQSPEHYRESFYDQEGNLDTQRGHVNFQTLYDAVCTSGAPSRAGADSGLSIIELPDVPFLPALNGIETSGHCHVEEVDSVPADVLINRTSRPTPSRIAFSEERVDHHPAGIPPFDKRVPLRGLNSDCSMNMPPSGYKRKGSKSAKVPYVTEPEEVISFSHISPSQVTDASPDENTDGLVNTKVSSQTSAKRPSTAKSRPQSRARPKSTSRPRSSLASRAGSRAGSRVGSRISVYGEGHLTKAPSSSLQAVAKLELSSPATDSLNTASLSGFFLAGVQSTTSEREIIPTSTRDKSKNSQYKISNRLYQMAPRSWRPDSSVSEAAAPSEVKVEQREQDGEQEVTLSYTYSGQVTGEPVQVHTGPVSPAQDSLSFPVRPPSTPKSRSVTSPHRRRVISPKVRTGVQKSPTTADTTESGRQSRAIVIDGDNLSQYDEDSEAVLEEQDQDDGQTLHQLEWELASEADGGKLSCVDTLMPEDMADDLEDEEVMERFSRLTTPGPGYDIDVQLREEELMDDFEEMERQITDEEAVKHLH
ncbi:uncharacterized protein LOC135479306 [Liolophura sinensis]|uniref:uncharacterized protein LOC135479306 n=1 Tax=Liolophura sinensis TaxID=3198878 RepID=UPI003158EE40